MTKGGNVLRLEVDSQSNQTLGPVPTASAYTPVPLHLGGLPGECSLSTAPQGPGTGVILSPVPVVGQLGRPRLGGDQLEASLCSSLSASISPHPRTHGHTCWTPHSEAPLASSLPWLHEESGGELVPRHHVSLCRRPRGSGGQWLPSYIAQLSPGTLAMQEGLQGPPVPMAGHPRQTGSHLSEPQALHAAC